MSKFDYIVDSINGNKTYKIFWKNEYMDFRIFNKISKSVKASTDYTHLDKTKINSLKSFLTKANKEFSEKTTLDQIISARNILIKNKIIKNYFRMNNKIEMVANKYNDGKSILDLARSYDFPPLNLLRGIFIHKKYNNKLIYKIFANKGSPEDLLKGRDLEQYKLAEENDAESIFNQQKIAKIAEENENKVGDFFKEIGIKMKLQDELVQEQVKESGRAVITPDYLFLDDVYINSRKIKWIDYKDYIGTTIHFLLKSNMNQAEKYNNEFGPGAMLYRYSAVENVVIPNTMILDGSALPINYSTNNMY